MKPLFALLAAALLVSPAYADGAKFHYLTDTANVPSIPQTPEDSPQAKADLDQVKDMQKHMLKSWRITDAKLDRRLDIFTFGNPTLGGGFNRTDLPQTEAFFDNVAEDLLAYAKTPQPGLRKRPFEIDGVKNCGDNHGSFNYPSIHGIVTGAYYQILQEFFPVIGGNIGSRSQEYADGRVLCGEEWPSEVNAGRAVGDAIARSMHKNPAFMADFEATKKELLQGYAAQMVMPPPAPQKAN